MSPEMREQYLRMLAAEDGELEADPSLPWRCHIYRLRQEIAHKVGIHTYLWRGVDQQHRHCTWCGYVRK